MRFAAFSESNINCLILKLSKQQFLCQDLMRHRSLQYNRERFRRPRVFSFTPWDWKLVMRRLLITNPSHMRRSDCNLPLKFDQKFRSATPTKYPNYPSCCQRRQQQQPPKRTKRRSSSDVT